MISMNKQVTSHALIIGSKTSNWGWCAGDIHGFTCVFYGDWVTQSNPCPFELQFWGQRPGASSSTAVHRPQRYHHVGKVSAAARFINTLCICVILFKYLLTMRNHNKEKWLIWCVACVCFVCSAYHGHVSSLIDISPYKFHQLSDAEQNQFVHVVSAFPVPVCLPAHY